MYTQVEGLDVHTNPGLSYHTSPRLSAREELTQKEVDVRTSPRPVSYTHLRAHETRGNLVCRLLLEKKKK